MTFTLGQVAHTCACFPLSLTGRVAAEARGLQLRLRVAAEGRVGPFLH